MRRVAGSLFFNDPFEQAHGKGHAACLDGLKIAWREQCLADVLDGTERLALDAMRKLTRSARSNRSEVVGADAVMSKT